MYCLVAWTKTRPDIVLGYWLFSFCPTTPRCVLHHLVFQLGSSNERTGSRRHWDMSPACCASHSSVTLSLSINSSSHWAPRSCCVTLTSCPLGLGVMTVTGVCLCSPHPLTPVQVNLLSVILLPARARTGTESSVENHLAYNKAELIIHSTLK